MPKRHYAVLRLSILMVSAILLTSCNMLTRLSDLKSGPQVSAIANPTARPKYRPVSMPMPMPRNVVRRPILFGDLVLARSFEINAPATWAIS